MIPEIHVNGCCFSVCQLDLSQSDHSNSYWVTPEFSDFQSCTNNFSIIFCTSIHQMTPIDNDLDNLEKVVNNQTYYETRQWCMKNGENWGKGPFTSRIHTFISLALTNIPTLKLRGTLLKISGISTMKEISITTARINTLRKCCKTPTLLNKVKAQWFSTSCWNIFQAICGSPVETVCF